METANTAIVIINGVIASVKQVTPKPYVAAFGGTVVLPQDTIQIYQTSKARAAPGSSGSVRW